jgi:hypothetical protein
VDFLTECQARHPFGQARLKVIPALVLASRIVEAA